MLQAQGCTCGLGVAHQPRRAHCSISRRRNRGQRTCRVWCGKGNVFFFPFAQRGFRWSTFFPLLFKREGARVDAAPVFQRQWRTAWCATRPHTAVQGPRCTGLTLFCSHTYNCRIKTCTPQSCPSTRPPCSVVGEKSSFSPDPSPTTTDKHASRALKCITVFPSGN